MQYGIERRVKDMQLGIARKVDALGRVVIPAEIRKLLGIHIGDQIVITVDGARVVLQKSDAACIFCGSVNGVKTFREKGVCQNCRMKLI